MRDLLLRVWSLPWPPFVRSAAVELLSVSGIKRLLFSRFLVGVVGVIQNERGEIMLLRHTYRARVPWGLPSGFLERGEQPSAALQREIREETGLDVELGPVWRVYNDPRRAHLTIVFAGRFCAGSFAPSTEVSALQFFPVADLPPLPPYQRELIEGYCRQEVHH